MAMGAKRSRRPRVMAPGWPMVLSMALVVASGLARNLRAQAQASVQQLFQTAQEAKARGDLEQAAQAYLEVIRRDPGMVNAFHNLGIVYFSQKKYGDAIPVLEEALRLNPRLVGAYVVLGLAHYELDQPQKAVAAFQAAHRLDPNDTNALLFLGKAQMQLGNYGDAAGTFEKLSQSRPKDPEVLYNFGLAHLKLLAEAMDRLRALAPQSYQLSLLEAQDADQHNNDAAAIGFFKEALSFKPAAVGVHYGLGIAYARASRYAEAAQEFKAELQVNPDDSLALWRLGEIALHTNPQEAERYLRQSVSLNPDFPQAVLAYGRALLRTGETEKAVEQFQRVVKIAPEEDTVHYLLANAYRKLDRRAESESEMATFQQMAGAKSAQRDAMARELAASETPSQDQSADIQPGFSRSREPVHP